VEHHGHLREQSLAGRTRDPDLAKALATTTSLWQSDGPQTALSSGRRWRAESFRQDSGPAMRRSPEGADRLHPANSSYGGVRRAYITPAAGIR
jgi:hypothetical protein